MLEFEETIEDEEETSEEEVKGKISETGTNVPKAKEEEVL